MLENKGSSKQTLPTQPHVEEVILNGIPITVTIDDQSTSPTINIQGPHKQWSFTIMQLRELVAWGYVKNIPDTQASITGETTALATVGLQQLQIYANRTQRTFRYKFDTENPAMMAWYNNGGRSVLGVTGFESDMRIMARREFRPTT